MKQVRMVAALAALISLPFIVGCSTVLAAHVSGQPDSPLTKQSNSKKLGSIAMSTENAEAFVKRTWMVDYRTHVNSGDYEVFLVKDVKNSNHRETLSIPLDHPCYKQFMNLSVDDRVKFTLADRETPNPSDFDPRFPISYFACAPDKPLGQGLYLDDSSQ